MKRLAVYLTTITLTFGVGVATGMIDKLPLVRPTPEEVRKEDGKEVFSALVSSAADEAAPGIRLTMTSAGYNAREIKLENLGSQPIVKYILGLSNPSFEGLRSRTMTTAGKENFVAAGKEKFVLEPGASTTKCVRARPKERVTAWVDFVEFADGTRWGPNLLGLAERPAQVYLPEEVEEWLPGEAHAAGQPAHECLRLAREMKF